MSKTRLFIFIPATPDYNQSSNTSLYSRHRQTISSCLQFMAPFTLFNKGQTGTKRNCRNRRNYHLFPSITPRTSRIDIPLPKNLTGPLLIWQILYQGGEDRLAENDIRSHAQWRRYHESNQTHTNRDIWVEYHHAYGNRRRIHRVPLTAP